MIIAKELSDNELTMESCQLHPSSLTCVSSFSPVQLSSTEDLRMWLQEVHHVNRFQPQANGLEKTTNETCGPQWHVSSMWFDQDSYSLRTYQACLIADISEPSSETWPKAGIVSDGKFYPQPSWERRIGEIGYGLWATPNANMQAEITTERASELGWSWNATHYRKPDGTKKNTSLTHQVIKWPTPNASDGTGGPGHSGREGGLNLRTAVRQWPTPRSSDYKGATAADAMAKAEKRGFSPNLPEAASAGVGGQLSPDWTEWLMGWPTGWTSLEPLTDIEEWLTETQTGEWWQHEHDLP